MKKLLSIVTLAIAAIASLKAKFNGVTTALADRDKLIADMKTKLDADDAEHAALIKRADDAEAHSAELDAANVEADSKADELAEALNNEPSVPTVDSGSFEVTAPPTATANDLAFREQQAESAPAAQ